MSQHSELGALNSQHFETHVFGRRSNLIVRAKRTIRTGTRTWHSARYCLVLPFRNSRNPLGLRALAWALPKSIFAYFLKFCFLFYISKRFRFLRSNFAKRNSEIQIATGIWLGHWHRGGHNGVTGGSQGGHDSQGGSQGGSQGATRGHRGYVVPCRHGHYTCYM